MNFKIIKKEHIKDMFGYADYTDGVGNIFFAVATPSKIRKKLLKILLDYAENNPENLVYVFSDYIRLKEISDEYFQLIINDYYSINTHRSEMDHSIRNLNNSLDEIFYTQGD